MADEKVHLLHEHYRDTCALMQSARASRDRYFFLVLAFLVPVLFDVYSHADYTRVVSEFLTKKLELTQAPDFAFVRSLLWFVLFGLTIRYCQATLLVERNYDYVHSLEKRLADELGDVFGREGRAYLSAYPVFLNWAHCLYSLLFPIALAAVVLVAACCELRSAAVWYSLFYIDLGIGAALSVSVALYLYARLRGR